MSVWLVWREDCVVDRNPAGQDAGHPDDRWPKSVGQKREEDIFGCTVVLVGNVPVHADANGAQAERDVQEVQIALAVPDRDLQTTPKRRSQNGITFVQLGFL